MRIKPKSDKLNKFLIDTNVCALGVNCTSNDQVLAAIFLSGHLSKGMY